MTQTTGRRTSVLDLLSSLHHLLDATRPLEDLLDKIASLLVLEYGARSVGVWMIDHSGKSRRAAQVGDRGWPEGLPEPPGIDLPASLVEVGSSGLTFTAVPGHARGKLRGVLGVWTQLPPAGERRHVLDLFAEHVALAIVDAEGQARLRSFAATLEGLVEATDAGLILVTPEPNSRVVFANERVEKILGIPLREHLGRPTGDVVEELGKVQFKDPEALAARFREGMADPETVVRDRFEMANGKVVERFATPARTREGEILGRVTVYRDVTRRERVIQELSGVAEIAAVFAGGGTLEELLSSAQAAIAKVMRVQRVTVARNDPVRRRFVLYRPTFGFDTAVEEKVEYTPYDPDDPVIAGLLRGTPFTSDSPSTDERIVRYRELIRTLGVGSVASVPLQVEGRVTGILSVWDPSDGRSFAKRDLRLLGVLAGQLAPFLRNAELIEERLLLAQAVREVDRVAGEIVAAETVLGIAARAVHAMVEELGLDLSRLWLLENGEMRVAAALGDYTQAGLEAGIPSPPVQRVLDTRRRYVTADVAEAGVDPNWIGPEGIVAFAGFPLILGSELIGVLTGYQRDPIRDEILYLMDSISKYAAIAIGKTRALERERMIARTLQEGLIPRALESLPGVSVSARYFSATSGAEVGGDLYDAFRMGDRCVLFVADVSGKGIAAASTAGLVRHSLRALAARESEGPAIMQFLNQMVVQEGEAQFVTALLGIFDPRTHRLNVTAAGHPPPVLRRRDGTVSELEARGPALGLFGESEFDSVTVDLEPGDSLLMYTDGIVECRNDGDMYGVERLLTSIGRRADGASDLVEAVVKAASDFCGESFGDDVAVIAAVVEEPGVEGTSEG